MKNIPENIKVALTSTAPLVAAIILFLLVGNFGISKVQDLRGQISKAQSDNTILTQKVSLLQNISGTIGNAPSAAAVALPDGNPALAVISQLKNLAAANIISISNIKGGAASDDVTGLGRSNVTFDLDGTIDQIITFLQSVSTIAPITLVDKVKISESGGIAKASISVKSFWAPLPKTLPSTNTQISDLTPDEQAILLKISSLVQPSFSQVPGAEVGGRTDPFTP